jgi:hypothetical protein
VQLQRLLLAAALGGLVLTALASASSPARFLRTTTAVEGLAMDGSTVALSTAWSAGHCEREVAWNPVRSSLRPLGRTGSCEATSTGRGILGQAIAGSRVAWVRDGGGNQHDSQLLVATLAKPRTAHQLATATRDIDTGAGDTIGHLHGDGSLLVYATWSVCDGGETPFRRCPAGVTPGTIYNAKLWRILGTTGKKLLASEQDELAPIAVAAGRILVQRASGALELRAADGRIVQTFTFEAPVLQATLGPKDLVVAVRDTTNRELPKGRLVFQVYDAATGAPKRTLSPPPSALLTIVPRCSFPVGSSPAACVLPQARLRFQDADASRFVYVLDTTVRVVRFADGTEQTIGTIGRSPVFAQLEPAGLVYAYRMTTRLKGRVQFVPARDLAG